MRKLILPYAVAAIVTTILVGLIYVSVQQQYRTSANDPQWQTVTDAASRLTNNKPAFTTTVQDTVQLPQSLSQFVQLYNAGGTLTYSTGYIGTAPPVLPAGVLAAAKTEGIYAVTWQPTATVRLAAVVAYTTQGNYIVAARSLAETEKREHNLLLMAVICWLLCLAVITAGTLLHKWL